MPKKTERPKLHRQNVAFPTEQNEWLLALARENFTSIGAVVRKIVAKAMQADV